MAKKRTRSTAAAVAAPSEAAAPAPSRPARRTPIPLPANVAGRRLNVATANPDANPDVLDGPSALRASPDDLETPEPGARPERDITSGDGRAVDDVHANTEPSAVSAVEPARRRLGRGTVAGGGAKKPSGQTSAGELASETAAADVPGRQTGRNKRQKATHVKEEGVGTSIDVSPRAAGTGTGTAMERQVGVTADPEVDGGPDADMDMEGDEDVKEALSRPPPVHSDYLPLPWKGRIGYACLNTYLRNANPPVFTSRTCRIASILEHRHPLKDPSQPEHPTKNRPDKEQPADIGRGQRYVEELGLANVRDLPKMLRWNDKYGIKFMRLSSEMFPFASHDEYGYKLAPFASEALAEVGRIAAELGHRLTTHPGQFTQLGSPRKSVIDGSFRDLEYHDELLSLLKLPPQQDRDAVMILHLGGAFGDKPAAIQRFRENYAKLSDSVKNRLVLENDDVVWNVHEVLPLCQELNIPFVLDFHHHNILFDATQIREGTKDVVELFPAIIETWTKKGKTPKMHYSEPCPNAITARSRRKHSPRVMTLPPCPDTMDLMIEAKDKEQAVFELMRTFKLPGFDRFNDIVPHVRLDENRPFKPKPKKAAKKGKKKADDLEALDMKLEDADEDEKPPATVPEEEVAMGGPENRVYWPPGMEDWLRPPKRIVKKKDEGAAAASSAKKTKNTAQRASVADDASLTAEGEGGEEGSMQAKAAKPAKKAAAKRGVAPVRKKGLKAVPTPSATDEEEESELSDLSGEEEEEKVTTAAPSLPTRKRSARASKVTYKEEDVDEMSM